MSCVTKELLFASALIVSLLVCVTLVGVVFQLQAGGNGKGAKQVGNPRNGQDERVSK